MPSRDEKAGDRRFTAYCGIYCKDCIPSDAALFIALGEFRGHLDRVGFGEYARAISKRDTIFNEYPVFEKVLGEIETLKCINYCREGGCKPGCEVRACAIGRAYEGCWECADFKSCGPLRPLRDVHPSLIHNLEMVREHGIEGWSGRRGKHYKWSKEIKNDESG